MTILKRVNAFDVLLDMVEETYFEDESKHNTLDKLFDYINDNELRAAFDNYITMEFPNGADEDEFREFCLKHTDEIYENI